MKPLVQHQRNRFSSWSCGLALLTTLSVGQAQEVTGFDVFKLQLYDQTSSAQPVTPSSFQFNARIFVSSSISDATAGVIAPSTTRYDLGASGTTFQHPVGFGSEAAMDTAFGAGNYDFSLLSADLNGGVGQTGTLPLGASVFPLSTPYFTNFASLQSLDVNQDFTLTWNAFDQNLSASLSQSFLLIVDNTLAGSTVIDTFFPDGDVLDYTLGASTLIAGHSYTATLFFSSRESFLGAWNGGGADGLVGFDRVTSASFTAIPEPSATALLAGGIMAAVALRRRQLSSTGARSRVRFAR